TPSEPAARPRPRAPRAGLAAVCAARRGAPDPGEELAVPQARILGLEYPVVFVRKVHQPGGHVPRLERVVVLQRLRHRHAVIEFAVNDQGRVLESSLKVATFASSGLPLDSASKTFRTSFAFAASKLFSGLVRVLKKLLTVLVSRFWCSMARPPIAPPSER